MPVISSCHGLNYSSSPHLGLDKVFYPIFVSFIHFSQFQERSICILFVFIFIVSYCVNFTRHLESLQKCLSWILYIQGLSIFSQVGGDTFRFSTNQSSSSHGCDPLMVHIDTELTILVQQPPLLPRHNCWKALNTAYFSVIKFCAFNKCPHCFSSFSFIFLK